MVGPKRIYIWSWRPRLVSSLGKECLGFHTVSCDIFSDIKVLAHTRARGRPSYAVSILIVGDIATGLVALIPMSRCQMTDVSQALDVLALRYRMPVRCIVDSGPQLRNLVNEDNYELTKGLSMQKIEVIVVPAGHQFCNPVARSIQVVKIIFRIWMKEPVLPSSPNRTISWTCYMKLPFVLCSLTPVINIPPSSLQDCSTIPSWPPKMLPPSNCLLLTN